MTQKLSINKALKELRKHIDYKDLKFETTEFGAEYKSKLTFLKQATNPENNMVIKENSFFETQEGYKTRTIANAMASILALKELGITVELKEVIHPNKTPLQVLNTFASKNNTKVIWEDINGFKQCKITIIDESNNPKEYIGSYPLKTGDLNYQKNKAAFKAYKQIIFDTSDDEELKNYMELAVGKDKFVLGKTTGFKEDYFLELKGNADKNVSMKKKEVNIDILVEQICGFLNYEGGSIYVGIHDDSTVQGIELPGSTLDDLKLKIQNKVLSKISPNPVNELQFFFYQVVGPKKDLYVLQILIKNTDNKDYRYGKDKKKYLRSNAMNNVVPSP
ncbi:hypothetical protein ACTFIZ_011464 [Dictyostelium cf. discoideum]